VKRTDRSVLAVVAWMAALAGVLVVLHRLGGGDLEAPPWRELADWVAVRGPAVAVMALVRLGALAMAWYLLALTSVAACLRAVHAAPAAAVVERALPGIVRRLLRATAGVTAATTLATSAAAGAAIPAVPRRANVAPAAATAPTSPLTAPDADPTNGAAASEEPGDPDRPSVPITMRRLPDVPVTSTTSPPMPPTTAPAATEPERGGSPTPHRPPATTPIPTTTAPASTPRPAPTPTPAPDVPASTGPASESAASTTGSVSGASTSGRITMRRLPDGAGAAPAAGVPPVGAPPDAAGADPAVPPGTAPPTKPRFTVRRLPDADLPTDGGGAAAHDSDATTVVVRAGDSLWRIAAFGLRAAHGREPTDAEIDPYWRALVALNRPRLRDPGNADLIRPGDAIELPKIPIPEV
jgi:hypothetical protein